MVHNPDLLRPVFGYLEADAAVFGFREDVLEGNAHFHGLLSPGCPLRELGPEVEEGVEVFRVALGVHSHILDLAFSGEGIAPAVEHEVVRGFFHRGFESEENAFELEGVRAEELLNELEGGETWAGHPDRDDEGLETPVG